MISVAPRNQNTPLTPSESAQSEAYTQASSTGDTEQLRLRNQWTFWPETVAKRNTEFGTCEFSRSGGAPSRAGRESGDFGQGTIPRGSRNEGL